MFTGSSASAPSSSTRRRGPASYRHRDPLSRSDLKYDSVSRGATDRDLPSTADALLADSVDSADGDIPLSTAGTRSGLYASHTVGSDDDTGLSSSKRRVMYATTGSSCSTHALRSRHSSRDALTSAPESTISPLHTGSSISLTSASLSVSSSTVLGTNGSAQGVVNTVGSTTSGTIGGRMGDSKLP